MWDEIVELLSKDCLASLQRVLIGVAIATIIGIPLGLLRSMLPTKLKHNFLLCFLLEAPKFPPPIAWIPIVVLLAGIGEFPAYIIVAIGALSPITTNVYTGANTIPANIKHLSQSLGLRLLPYISKVLLPNTLPSICVGVRNGLSMGWMSVIAAEMVSGSSGLGYKIQLFRLRIDYSMVLIDIGLIGAIGYFLFYLADILEKKILIWRIEGVD